MSLGIFAMTLGCVLSANSLAEADSETPTPATLEKWLEDKEVVQVVFAGPHMPPMKLLAALKLTVPVNDPDFWLTPGEGGGADRAFIQVCIKATPENNERLRALQQVLGSRQYKLDAEATRVWSYQGNKDTRAEAIALTPVFMAAVERGLKQIFPTVQYVSQKGRLRYEVPATKVRGSVSVSQITAGRHWQGADPPDQQVHLPHLGLMIQSHVQRAQFAPEKLAAEHAAIRKLFEQSVQPFLKLEPGAAIKSD